MSEGVKLDKTAAQVNQAINEQYDGNQVGTIGYDDIQGNVQSARKLAGGEPTDRMYNYGISGGVEFAATGFAVGDAIYYTVQTPHAMKLSSVLEQHFHFTVPTDGTGKKFKMRLDVIAAGVFGNWTKPASSPFEVEFYMTEDLSNSQWLEEFGTIEAINTTVSSLYKLKVSRIAASDNEYLGEVYMEFIDGHMQIDQERGSREEFVK